MDSNNFVDNVGVGEREGRVSRWSLVPTSEERTRFTVVHNMKVVVHTVFVTSIYSE